MHTSPAILCLTLLPLWSCQVVSTAHGDPPIELSLDTGEEQAAPTQTLPWPIETRIDTDSGRFDLIWDPSDSEAGHESIPLEAILQVELARAYDRHPDELFIHLVNTRRILISRGDQVATQAAVLSTWLERPVTELPSGVGHLEVDVPQDRPPPRLKVNTAGGTLSIQPITDSTPVETTTIHPSDTATQSSTHSGTGRGHREDIDRTIKTEMTRFRGCYQRQLQRNPVLQGQVIIEVTINIEGTVRSAKTVDSSLGNPLVEQCIIDELKRLQFPPPKGGDLVVRYPFTFSRS